ncbi:helicase [Paecilomyces lecythidis]
MVFKPFKPPLMRKPPPKANQADETSTPQPPPAKRRRVSDQDGVNDKDEGIRSRNKVERGVRLAGQSTARKPLVQVKNSVAEVEPKVERSTTGNTTHSNAEEEGEECYYNVLWRKFTMKKNKTWDGDGVLSVRGGYAYLKDVSGRDMGKTMLKSTVEPGVMLSIGGKEVEVDSAIPKKEYLSGRQFLGGAKAVSPKAGNSATKKTPVQVSKIVSRTMSAGATKPVAMTKSSVQKVSTGSVADSVGGKSMGMNNAFKNPLKDSTVMSRAPMGKPTPRHDPSQPGALVMKRPGSAPKGKQIVDVVVDPLLTKHLRQHQREGVQFLYECVMGLRDFGGEGAILADDMGLGKTLQTITLLWTLLKQNPIYEAPPVVKKALIVCPVTLINNWRKEFRKWLGNERIGVFLFDDKKKRLTDFTRGRAYSVMIVGYEKLRTVQEGLAQGSGIDIVIADEGHRLKTLQNKSGQAIQSLSTAKRVILSGTPIQNELSEFFAAVDLVNPGLLGSYKTFMKEFEGPIVRSRQPEATKKDIEKGEARNEELRSLTAQFMLRRTADILAKYLPPKTEYVLFCNPTSTQANIYHSVLGSPVFQSVLGNSESALQLITILKKLCNSPSLLNPKSAEETPNTTIAALLSTLPPNLLRHFSPSSSGKIRVLDQLLHNLHTTTSEKIVIVSNYTSTLNLLANLLASLSLPFLRLDGSTPAAKRQPLVDNFNRTPASACFAFLLSAKAGGTGLNLIGASRLILFDVDWNPATDLQAMARIHRDGQKKHCRIYRILLKGSLEEKIWQRQVTKIGLADSVMEQKGGGMAQFSREELKDLFRLDETSICQTHELLGCDCGGRGIVQNKDDSTSSDDANTSEEEQEEEDLPDLPTLLKASEVDMEAQERRILEERQRRNKGRKNNKMQQFLSHFAHIDPSVVSDSTATEDEVATDINDLVDDDVLVSLLKDEDNRIRYVFKKTTGAGI